MQDSASPQRKIIHVDMDCFYAAVEEKDNPALKGKPVAVSGSPQSRAVVCTANYEARKFGVRAAIPASRAQRICPQLIFVEPHFERYRQVSDQIRQIFSQFTDRIEPLSFDEAYLDVTGEVRCQGSATLMAQEIRKQIWKELGLRASAGVAPNKFLAKIASDWKKPNGLYVIRPDQVEAFMPSLDVERIFGVGRVTAKKMHELGFHTCGDIQKASKVELARHFGQNRAEDLYAMARGIDEREVVTEWQRKSVSVEETFQKDISYFDELKGKIPGLYEDFKNRLKACGGENLVKGFVVKIKYFDFQGRTHERSSGTPPAIQDFEVLLEELWRRRSAPVRLLGLGVRLGTDSAEAPSDPEQELQLKFAVNV